MSSPWETKCWCGKYDDTIGQTVWCYLHKGPHPLICTTEEIAKWRKAKGA